MSDLLLNAWIENLICDEIQQMSEEYTLNKDKLTQAGVRELYFDCCRGVAFQAYRFGYERGRYHEEKGIPKGSPGSEENTEVLPETGTQV